MVCNRVSRHMGFSASWNEWAVRMGLFYIYLCSLLYYIIIVSQRLHWFMPPVVLPAHALP